MQQNVQQLIEEQLSLEADLVSDRTYQARWKICSTCPSLYADTTCLHCGCFVQFRARLAYKNCPNPGGSHW
ncbi:DUF6171 family protein [Rossellomorea sp. BNER]|uniref:DUF6171 family protein n=1 Tax=Rossellomorea sp. BNER TaxID=2962031 RepID=UPI003AF2DDEB|nr:DUF6171 family protein [Rossellomorea sp. BNER]